MTLPLTFPLLRRVRKGDKVGMPARCNGYITKPAPSDGLHVTTLDDVMFLSDTQLSEAGWVRDKAKAR